MKLRKLLCRVSIIIFFVSSARATEDTVNAADTLRSDVFLAYLASNKVQLLDYIIHSAYSNDVEILKGWNAGQEPPRTLLSIIQGIARFSMPKGGWIDDKAAISFFMAAMRSRDGDMFTRATKQLQDVSPTALIEYEGWLIDVARRQSFGCPPDLLHVIVRIRRTPSPEVKALVREQPSKYAEHPRYWGKEYRVPPEILARIGDQDAEHELIVAFQSETNGAAKCELAQKLGYAASSNTLRTIVQDFRNPLVVATLPYDTPYRHGGRYSMRYAILRGLRDAFPDETLFTSEMDVAVKCVENYYNIPLLKGYETNACFAPAHAYFDKVEAWMTSRFNVQWNVSRPQDITLKQNVSGYTPIYPPHK